MDTKYDMVVSSRIMRIRMNAIPRNISRYMLQNRYDNKVEKNYDELQATIAKMPKKDIEIVQGDWNAKIRHDLVWNSWQI